MPNRDSLPRGTACRNCGQPATCAIRSGLEWHPTCDECASWWSDDRRGPLSEVADDYGTAFERLGDALSDLGRALLAAWPGRQLVRFVEWLNRKLGGDPS